MHFNPRAGILKLMATGISRRRAGRLPQDTLACNIGIVLDISAGGMRVLCTKMPPRQLEVSLFGHQLPGPLTAQVSWYKRVGLFKREVGMCFVNVTPEIANCLTSIARDNRLRRAV